jgi:hypothetical protein
MAGGAGVVVAAVVTCVCFLLGTLTAAQGQILKAALDTAVNSSRLLSDEDCIRILSMPIQVPARPVSARGAIPVDRVPVRGGVRGSV